MNSEDKLLILLLGGSKFMGLNLVERIINESSQKSQEIHLFIINRGNCYWNGKFYELIENKNWIHHYKADRRDRLDFHKCLSNVLTNADDILKNCFNDKYGKKRFIFDYVIDFTAFKRKDIFNLFDFLAFFDPNSFDKYILISTDSTYNASDIALERNNEYFVNKFFHNNEEFNKFEEIVDKNNKKLIFNDFFENEDDKIKSFLNNPSYKDWKKYELIKEEKAKMSQDPKSLKKLEKMDDYGFKKLETELLLKEIFSNSYYNKNNQEIKFEFFSNVIDLLSKSDSNFDKLSVYEDILNKLDFSNKKYIFLRLPDVIGPFDESYRIWCYLEWIKLSNIYPIEFEKVDLVRKLSFVSRDDVNIKILDLIFTDEEKSREKFFNTEFNISFDEIVTLKELIDILYCILSKNNPEMKSIGYYYCINDGYAQTYLPSVTCGAVSNEKAREMGFFKAKIELIEYLRKTVEFFENEGKKFEKEYQEMKKELPKSLRKSQYKKN